MPTEEEYRWERVDDPTTLQPGEYVRAMNYGENSADGRVWCEGVVDRVVARYVRINGGGGTNVDRPYFRRVAAGDTWVPIEPGAIREGMYVRGTSLPEFSVRNVEGHVDGLRGDNEIHINQPGRGYMYLNRRTWERRVSAPEATAPSTVALATPLVGDRFARTFNVPTQVPNNPARREPCVVTHMRHHPEGGWVVNYDHLNEDGTVRHHYGLGLRVMPDGSCQPDDALERTESGDVSGTYEPLPAAEPQGWVPVTDLSTLRVGDIVRATPNGIGGRMQARVTDRNYDGYNAMTTHVITPSGNGEAIDRTCWDSSDGYYYGDVGHDTEVWRGPGEAPVPEQGQTPDGTWVDVESGLLHEGDRVRYRMRGGDWTEGVVASVDSDEDVYLAGVRDYVSGGCEWQRWTLANPPALDYPVPDWATSLDAAKRHVHERAVHLFKTGDNCSGGTNDFLRAAGLPLYNETYPAPPDESEEVKRFLIEVRRAALRTADRHGKDSDLVFRWLDREGIVEPPRPAVEYTITVKAPAGTTREDVINSARQLGREGWEIN